MRTLRLFAILLSLATAHPCIAQLMSGSQYRDYMKGLDAAVQRWQTQVDSINVGKMDVDYTTGQHIESFRGSVLRSLKALHVQIGNNVASSSSKQGESLSVDILIENYLGDISFSLVGLTDALPSNDEGRYWNRNLMSTIEEMSRTQEPLRDHIVAYADKLQLKASICTK
jgi:hypothetical protein